MLANLAELADHGTWVSSSSAVPDSDNRGPRYNVVELLFRWIALPYRRTPDENKDKEDEDDDVAYHHPRLQRAALQTVAKLSFDEEG